MKKRYFSADSRLSLPQIIQFATVVAALVAGPPVQAVDYYKANNTTSLTSTGSWWFDAAGTTVATSAPNNTTTSTAVCIWNNLVTGPNTVLTVDVGMQTLRILDPGGLVTLDGGSTLNKTLSIANGGGIDMSNATQDLTIINLSTATDKGLRLAGSNAVMNVNVASGRTFTVGSKVVVNGASGGATVNFTGAGTSIFNSTFAPSKVTISGGEVQFNNAAGSTRISTNSTTVTGGKLVVNNISGSATGSGAVTVSGTGTVTGVGIMSGLVTIDSGGTIRPGNGLGTLKAGSLTLAANSTIHWEGDPSAVSPADLIDVTGTDTLIINGGSLQLFNAGTSNPFTGTGIFNIFKYNGSIPNIGNLSVAESSKIQGQTYLFGVSGGFVTLAIGPDTRPKAFWNTDADGTWSLPGNWTDLSVPNAPTFIANLGGTLGTPITAPRTVTLDGPHTVGTLNFDSAQPFTLAGASVLSFDEGTSAGTLHVENGSHVISAPLALPAEGILTSIKNVGSTLTIESSITGDGYISGISKSGPGTLILAADNSYQGATSNGAGVLQIGTGGTSGSVLGTIANNGTLRINRSEPFRFIYSISGTGGVDFVGSGTSTLAVPNAFSGPTTISAGTVEIEEPTALQDSTLTYSSTGGTLTYLDGTKSVVLGGLTGDKSLPLSYTSNLVDPPAPVPVSLTVGQNNASTSYAASTTGTGAAFTKTGSGTFSLSGTHVFSGATTIIGGVLSLDSGSDFTTTGVSMPATGAKFRVNGGTLHSSGDSSLYNSSAGFEITAGTANFGGKLSNVNLTAADEKDFFINVTGGALNAGSVDLIRGNLNIGTEPTTGQNTKGLYINGGAVSITGLLSIGGANTNSSVSTRMDSGSLTVGGPLTVGINNASRWSVLDIGGGTFTSSNVGTGVRIGSAFAGQAIMLVRGGVATAERFQFGQPDFAGKAILNQTGGSLYVGAGGMVVGSTAISAQLRLGGGVLGATADFSSNVPVSLSGAAVVTGADSLNVPHTVSFSGNVTGTGSLVKNGSGTVSFTSPGNSFSGSVSVTSGTLGLGGQTGGVTVASTATLAPSGTLNAQAASTIDGTLAIRYDVPALLSPGSIRSQGVLTLGAASTLNISGTGTLTAPFYTIASGAAGVSGTFGSVTGTVPTGYSLVYNHNNGSGTPVVALRSDSATNYDTWAAAFGLSGANAGTNADPDADGLNNLLEFGLGSNPSLSSATGPVLGRTGDFLTLTFNHIADPNLVFSIEASDSLTGTWNTVHTFPTFAAAGMSTYTDNVTIGSTDHRFIRLSVTLAN